MSRVKRGSVARKHRKKVLKFNKGFVGAHSTLYRPANQQSMKAFRYSYVDRRKRKREFRKLWIRRINAASRVYGVSYSDFMNKLKTSKVILNRKVLAQIAILDVKSFKYVVDSIA